MNRDRQPMRSQQPASRLDGRQAPRGPTNEDWHESHVTVFRDSAGHVLPLDDVEPYDDPWPTRLPSSSRRYDLTTQQGHMNYTLHPTQMQRLPIPARRSALPPPAGRMTEERSAPPRRRRSGLFRSHPLLWVGCGMLVMLLAWTGSQALGAWWSVHQDDATYGRPRTAQYDVVVGHSDSASTPTHFIAMNLNATVVVIELPGGDSSKARIYRGPNSSAPARTSFRSRSVSLIRPETASPPWRCMCRERLLSTSTRTGNLSRKYRHTSSREGRICSPLHIWRRTA